MTYMLLIYVEHHDEEPSTEAAQAMWADYAAFTEKLRTEGVFLAGDPLEPVDTATTVRRRDGRRIITDGPFAETKEWLGGYYLLDCTTLDQAIAYAAACPGSLHGSVEIRPLGALG